MNEDLRTRFNTILQNTEPKGFQPNYTESKTDKNSSFPWNKVIVIVVTSVTIALILKSDVIMNYFQIQESNPAFLQDRRITAAKGEIEDYEDKKIEIDDEEKLDPLFQLFD